MDANDFEDQIAAILDAREGRSAVDAGAGVDNPAVLAALEAVDLAWEAQMMAPPLEDDPTAIMLGLVPDPEVTFDGAAAQNARKRAGLTVTQLASKLEARGWDVSSQDVFAWEHSAQSVVPAIVRAIAAETNVEPDSLVRPAGVDEGRERLRSIFAMTDFRELAARWARMRGTSISAAMAALESRTLAAVHRGGAPDPQVVIHSLEALIESLEDEGDSTTP